MSMSYTLRVDAETFKTRFGLWYLDGNFPHDGDAAPGRPMPVITRHSPKQAQVMRWGLINSWSKYPDSAHKAVTLAADIVIEKAAFRRLLLTRRCLVPATGYQPVQKTKTGEPPTYVTFRNQPIFAFAGVYDVWRNQEGREIKTFTILTTSISGIRAKIDTQMPIILSKEAETLWLNPDTQDLATLRTLFTCCPEFAERSYEGMGFDT
jgi:putative SOS response-associated peptidase YedK